MLKQQLQQKLQQKLSPQQIQLIRLIELPAIELEERVKHELEDNPALEEGKENSIDDNENDTVSVDDDDIDTNADFESDISLGDYMTEDDIPEYKLREMTERDEKKENTSYSAGESLNEYLLQQLGLRELEDTQVQIAQYIIGNIDDDGYLRRDLSSIADDIMFQTGQIVNEKDIENVLFIIQDFDPTGVGARNLKECLMLQLKHKNKTDEIQWAIRILNEYFDDFTRKHYDKILHGLNINEETLKKAVREITALDPKPCGSWENSMEASLSQVIPDFIVEAVNGDLVLSMNN